MKIGNIVEHNEDKFLVRVNADNIEHLTRMSYSYSVTDLEFSDREISNYNKHIIHDNLQHRLNPINWKK